MADNGLTALIVEYIASRKQPKLEALEKDLAKRLAGLTEAEEIAVAKQTALEQRQELEKNYTPRDWLTDAASRAGQISLVTHALKFTHSDAKGSSIFATGSASLATDRLSSASLTQPAIDAVGNAAALDVAKLLQLEYEGESLIACLSRGDSTPLAVFAENPQQLELWVAGFKQVLANKTLSSHTLAKQLYFPVGPNEYHLLSPLFSSSLAHAMHQRISDARFSDAAKESYQALKAGEWSPSPRVIYPKTAVLNMGGTKPQNISYLNSVRGGRAWLLPCSAPVWLSVNKPPLNQHSIFQERKAFSAMARDTVWQLKQYLRGVNQSSENTAEIRQQRSAYLDEIIDILFGYVAGIQNCEDWQCWSQSEGCQLSRAQQLWLDPWRMNQDEDFRFEREGDDWKKEIALDFGVWLNHQLKSEEMKFSEVERCEWSTAPLFKRRLREFEAEFKGDFA
ncbi:type I-F CRISPR-associated protein Csy1 [Serratia proteamaculans]|uniref:type I-F CRISPR-associated protein Csy1 n=1 Tax=Serratia proteamaculans TaxID=28151 RepID=UPI0015A30D82|nr:type I-F CRISPR-associated protein Csy1 [Serratia proteamaculans]NWA73006.1 type I-F CRISPR-associated protein Csy1 [Serratia proteamaculans]